MKMHTPDSITLRDERGVHVSVDLTNLKLDDAQRAALRKLLAARSHASLTEQEWNIVKDIRAAIRGHGDAALIVRFDWKWVRIDEPGRRFEEVIREGPR